MLPPSKMKGMLTSCGVLAVAGAVFLAIVTIGLSDTRAAQLEMQSAPLPHPLASLEKFGFCDGNSCESCVSEHHVFGNCRWCEMTKSCHTLGSLLNKCSTALHTDTWACQSKAYPYQMQSFVSDDQQSALQFAFSIKGLIFGKDVPFPLVPAGRTLRYDVATGNELKPGQRPAAAGPLKIGIAADWGAGTKEAAAVASLLGAFGAKHTVHMGDVYYVGDETDYKTNYFGVPPWPGGIGVEFPAGSVGHWPLVGNHEMLSHGTGIFDFAMPKAGIIKNGKAQGMPTSFAALETDAWRIVMIDDSFNSYPSGIISAAMDSMDISSSCAMPDSEVDWLKTVISDPSDRRGIILLGHHNYRNAFGASCKEHVEQLAKILPQGREIIWLYGHIHSFQMQNLKPASDKEPIAAWSRCVGNGGFTQEIKELLEEPKFNVDINQAWDRRVYRTLPITTNTGASSRQVAFNGYATLVLDGPKASFEYRTFACDGDCTTGGPSFKKSTLLASEEFTVNAAGNAKLTEQLITENLHSVAANKPTF